MIFARPLRRLVVVMERERKFLLRELARAQGLMPLLMKTRNGERWTVRDKNELLEHFRRLSRMSPYIAMVLLPGGFALLPLLAWWLDRRRGRRDANSELNGRK